VNFSSSVFGYVQSPNALGCRRRIWPIGPGFTEPTWGGIRELNPAKPHLQIALVQATHAVELLQQRILDGARQHGHPIPSTPLSAG
jgi:hypothetical protein